MISTYLESIGTAIVVLLTPSVIQNVKFLINHGYTQLVKFPTRNDNILDLLLTDDDRLIHGVEGCPPIGNSDHTCIHFSIDLSLHNNLNVCLLYTSPSPRD